MIPPGSSRPPLVSVVIATRNRAEMLRESMHSVLSQSLSDIELIVVDDGSEDDTRRIVQEHSDSRIRYFRQNPAGISSARNLGTDHARGAWIAVHDDDDIMLPFRLAEQMKQADEDVDFVYGAFINFDDSTAELQLHHGRNYSYGAALMSGFAPGHSTWLVRTEVMRRFRYDEGIDSAVDNNLAFRMLRSGVRFRHSGVVCLLRRVHSGRITDRGGASQKYVATMNLAFLGSGVSSAARERSIKSARYDWGPVDKTRWQTRFLPYLPDHLVRRSGYVASRSISVSVGELESSQTPVARLEFSDVRRLDWWRFFEAFTRGADARAVRARPLEAPVIESLVENIEITEQLDTVDPYREALDTLLEIAPPGATSHWFAVARAHTANWDASALALSAARCIFTDADEEETIALIPFRTWEAADAAHHVAFTHCSSYRVFTNGSLSTTAAELGAR